MRRFAHHWKPGRWRCRSCGEQEFRHARGCGDEFQSDGKATINYPQVVALIYRIEHSDSTDYRNAKPFCREEQEFHLSVKDRKVRFALYGHYATEEDTRESIAEYIRVWEFDARLKRGPDSFRLEFENSEIVDRRNPTPGAVRLRGRLAIRGIGAATLTVSFSDYPSPPSDIALNADVEMMHQRYLGYRQGRKPFASMANFCLTVLESTTGEQ